MRKSPSTSPRTATPCPSCSRATPTRRRPATFPAIEKLQQHGIRVERLDHALHTQATAYRLTDPKWAAQPFENRLMLKDFKIGEETREETYPAGSFLVRMDQRAANVIVHLLEPQAPDSLLRWGYFNIVFEQREYADARVAERIARELIQEHPEVKTEFEEKLKAPAFAKSAEARLDFFFQKSLWHDERLGLYPIVRLDAAQLEKLRAP